MKPRGEADHCRNRLLRYCIGQGIDIGCGACKIKPEAIGIDKYHPDADMRRDGRILEYYPSNLFDFVFSSHLLEEIESTSATLREWTRVLKPGGYLVLYQAEKDLYYPFEDPQCNPSHKHHFDWETLWGVIERLGDMELIHHACYSGEPNKEWSFELVTRKKGGIDTSMTEEGISLLIPTLNRPNSMKDFAESVDKTTKDANKIELLFGIHEDDTKSIEMASELGKALHIKTKCALISRYSDGKPHLSHLWNQLYAKATNPILGYFGDDVLFKTPGWDIEVRAEFSKNKCILLSCNDVHVQQGKQATLFFTHKIVHDAIGYYLYPDLRRWYMDTALEVIYRNCRTLIYRADLLMEHLHPDVYPERKDHVYTVMEEFKKQDKILWHSETMRNEIIRTNQVLQDLLKCK
jgi:hypothetical protein